MIKKWNGKSHGGACFPFWDWRSRSGSQCDPPRQRLRRPVWSGATSGAKDASNAVMSGVEVSLHKTRLHQASRHPPNPRKHSKLSSRAPKPAP